MLSIVEINLKKRAVFPPLDWSDNSFIYKQGLQKSS